MLLRYIISHGDGENSLSLDRVRFDLHKYSLRELSSLLSEAGWEVEGYS
jgi:hypothetical protein